MTLRRLPIPPLRPYVALIWASDGAVSSAFAHPLREHALPTGSMHLVFRLSDSPLRILASHEDRCGQSIGASAIGGARSRFYIREMSAPSSSVGAVLRPGAAASLFGVTAAELAERHTLLADVWGGAARDAQARLADASGAADRLARLESILLGRLSRIRGVHPAIESVIGQMHALASIDAAVERSNVSHRQFVALFRRAVGLTPKVYLRVLRFQRVLLAANRSHGVGWAALAADAGYSDQAHFSREFLQFTGVTPTTYRRLAPPEPNHLPLTAHNA